MTNPKYSTGHDKHGFYMEDRKPSKPTKPRKVEGDVQKNYDDYIKTPHHIGFDHWPTVEVLDTITIKTKCRTNYDVTFDVRYVKVSLEKSSHVIFHAIVTDRVDIGSRLPLGGFNSYCCYDEANTMELGIVEMAKKHNLMICDKKCSWPSAQAVVQDNFYKGQPITDMKAFINVVDKTPLSNARMNTIGHIKSGRTRNYIISKLSNRFKPYRIPQGNALHITMPVDGTVLGHHKKPIVIVGHPMYDMINKRVVITAREL